MAKVRVTEQFVRLWTRLREATGNDPNSLSEALDRTPELPNIIRELELFDWRLRDHQANSPRRYIAQAHPEFAKARNDYQARWSRAGHALMNWQHKRDHGETFDEYLDRIEKDILARPLQKQSETSDVHYPDDFDPRNPEDSAFRRIDHLLSELKYRADVADDYGSHEWADVIRSAIVSMDWFKRTLEIDLEAAEQRWRKLRMIAVPSHVSNSYGVPRPDGRVGNVRAGLFGLLDDARRAYVSGSPLAALALCRALTELLIKRHYLQNPPKELGPAIAVAEANFSSLRKENLGAKVKVANDVLHSNSRGRETLGREELAVREWLATLQRLIEQAPPKPK